MSVTEKLKIYKKNVTNNGKSETLSIILIENSSGSSKIVSEEEVLQLLDRSWGKFPKSYVKSSIFKSYLLCLIRNKKGELIGLAPLKKLMVLGSEVYSFGLTAVDPKYRQLDLLKQMGFTLGKKIIFENLVNGRIRIEVIFITPNIRTLGTISRIASFVYPNPYDADENGKVGPADDVTWKRVEEFLKLSGENYRKLEREGCVMEGFYDDKPELAVRKKISHLDPILDKFGEKYLYQKTGRELVVRAKLNFWKLMFGVI